MKLESPFPTRSIEAFQPVHGSEGSIFPTASPRWQLKSGCEIVRTPTFILEAQFQLALLQGDEAGITLSNPID